MESIKGSSENYKILPSFIESLSRFLAGGQGCVNQKTEFLELPLINWASINILGSSLGLFA